jgi:hypothetical protein
LIIDAVDLLHGGRVDGSCLIASDGDYSQLAICIREHGRPVFGFGVNPPHPALMAACTQFMHLVPGQIEPAPAPAPSARPLTVKASPRPVPQESPDSLIDVSPRRAPKELRPLLTQAVQENG